MKDIKTHSAANEREKLRPKDFTTDQDIRWCPGCGDYSILKQVQNIMPELGIPREDIVFISGIGCSSRFPYYMNTYGMHGIHGRATAIATGLKAARPELSVWIITGDGDSLSIGGNHLIHLLRRNPDVNILLFNNEVYGLTKGQYSPTSQTGQRSKSSPDGNIDSPFNPLTLALGAGSTFVARAMDRDPVHLREVLMEGQKHKGASYLEIYQNCNIFNDGAFEIFTDKTSRSDETIYLEHGSPLIFGKERDKGIRLDGIKPEIVKLENGISAGDLWIHDETDRTKADILARFFDRQDDPARFPRPFGILYRRERPTYEESLHRDIQRARDKKGEGDLDDLLRGKHPWVVQ